VTELRKDSTGYVGSREARYAAHPTVVTAMRHAVTSETSLRQRSESVESPIESALIDETMSSVVNRFGDQLT
jgi:hypothetical protein